MTILDPGFGIAETDDDELEAAWRARVCMALQDVLDVDRNAFADEVIARGECGRRGLPAMCAWPDGDLRGYFREMQREGVF